MRRLAAIVALAQRVADHPRDSATFEPRECGFKIVRLVAYPTYADIEAVKTSDHTLYDQYTYRNGKAAFEGPGGTLDKNQNTIDPNTVNWDALPNLIRQADAELNVPNPTIHYIIVDSDIINQQPELFVYVSDDYGGGYLRADLTGKVTRKVPRGS